MLYWLGLCFAVFLLWGKIENCLAGKEQIGRILSVDNSNVVIQGITKVGAQRLRVAVTLGKESGKEFEASNLLTGSLEYDELYQEKDQVLLAISEKGSVREVKVLSLMRMQKIGILLGLFVLALLLYAREVGLKSLLSFVGSVLVIWEYLIPALKSGENVFEITILTLIFLSGLIIFLVAGWSKKAVSAFLGTLAGLFVTAFLTFFFGETFRLDGMNQPLAQSLVFSSYMSMDLLKIFYAAIIIGASGAAMDIAMDMSATIEELKFRTPNMTQKDLIASGFHVGKAVIGTMTTTLLLAYSGGFLTMLILFLERDITLLQVLNMKIFVPEMVKIIIGSIGLVAVAPITTYIAAFIYSKNWKRLLPIEDYL